MNTKLRLLLAALLCVSTSINAVTVTHPSTETNNFNGPVNVKTGATITIESGGAITISGTGSLGTPSSLTLTNATGLPVSTGISGLGTGSATALAAGVSAGGNGAADAGKLVTYNTGGVLLGTGFCSVFPTATENAALALNTLNEFTSIITPGVVTASRTNTLPDADGTFITTGNLSDITGLPALFATQSAANPAAGAFTALSASGLLSTATQLSIGSVVEIPAIGASAGAVITTNRFAIGATVATPDVLLLRDAANTLALRNGSAEQEFRLGPSGSYVSFASNAGVLAINSAVTAAGGLEATQTVNGELYVRATNGSSGGSAQTIFSAVNNSGHVANFTLTGSGYSNSEPFTPDTCYFFTNAGSGINVISSAASQPIRFYAGGYNPTDKILTLDPAYGARLSRNTGDVQFQLSGAAGTNRAFFLQTNGSHRWALYEDDLAEAGSNAGSNLWLTRFKDDGTGLGDVFFVKRDTGNIILGGDYGGIPTDMGGTLQVLGETRALTSGQTYSAQILPTYNQASGTAANTDLLINRTETAIGSGTQRLIDAQVGGSSKFSVDRTGAITSSGGSVGTTAGGNATAGNVGEYVSASVVVGSATALTTATPKTVTSITLTAGDWDITGIGAITGASTGTVFDVAVGDTTNAFTNTVLGDSRCQTPTVSLTGADASLMVPAVRVSNSTTKTYYLIVSETFTIGSPAAYGRISARRIR